MAEQSLLAKLGLRTGTIGSVGSLAIAFGNSGGSTPSSVHTAANRTGFYAGLSGGSELIAMVVGGQTGPVYQRNGSNVDVAVSGALSTTGNVTAQNGVTNGVRLVPNGGAGNFIGNFTTTVLTADRTYTFPDASISIPGGSVGAGQVVIGAAGNTLTSSGVLTYDSTNKVLNVNANAVAVGSLPAAPAGSGARLTGADGANSRLLVDAYGTGIGALITSRLARGTAALPTAVQSGDTLGSHNAYGYGLTGYSSSFRGRLAILAAENWGDTSQGTQIALSITANGTATPYDAAVLGNDGSFTLKNGNLVGIALAPQGGAANFTGTITTALLSANRTYTFPDVSGTIAIQGGALGTNQNIPFTNGSGQLQTAAGLIVVGTPSATAPSAGTNGPGTIAGPNWTASDGSGGGFTSSSFGNGVSQAIGMFGFTCQGTAASPSATTTNDAMRMTMRGHDGSAFTGAGGIVELAAGSTWSGTNRETYFQVRTTASGSTSLTTALRVDGNQVLVTGGGSNSVSTFSAGTLRPKMQAMGVSAANAAIAQCFWANAATGPTFILAKSRSGTVGTQGVITTGDTLGSMSWQGDDGTNFIPAAQIVATATGTIGTGQVPGRLAASTASSAGTMIQAFAVDSGQVLFVGSSAQTNASSLYSGGTITPIFQVTGKSGSTLSQAAIGTYSNTTGGSSLFLGKSRGAALGTMTVVTTGDTLGTLDWQGADGTNFVSAAKIIVTATGTPASGVMPGQMVIKTADSAGTLTTAITVDNAQTTTFNPTTASSSTTTGTVVINGGAGIAGAVNIGGAGTVTTSLPALNITQTWNASGVTFTGIFANITSTASAAGSLVMDLQVGSSSVLNVGKTGVVTAAASTDISAQFGYLKVGFVPSGTSTQVYLAQTSVFTTSGYMLVQNSSGDTSLNSQTGRSTTFRIGNTSKGTLNATALSMTVTGSFAPAVATSGSSVAFTITGAANTGQTATVECRDLDINLARTVQFNTGAIATQRAVYIQAPTYAFVGASTITTAATVAIAGAPAAGTNATITKSITLWVQGGYTQLDGRLLLNAPNSAPTDADIPTSAVSFYLDEVGNNLKVRVRYSDGTTLKTGTVVLV